MLEVRKARKSDLERILEITRRAWGNMAMAKLIEDRHGRIGEKDWADRKCEVIREFFEINMDKVLVAQIDQKIVGYAEYDVKEGIGIVGNNAVDPDYQRRGIGYKLVSKIVEILKEKAKVLTVTTLQHDLPAQKIYEKLGFKEIARSVHYTKEV